MIETITISTYVFQVKELLIGLGVGLILGLLIMFLIKKFKKKPKKFYDLRQELGKVHLKIKEANSILIQLYNNLIELEK